MAMRAGQGCGTYGTAGVGSVGRTLACFHDRRHLLPACSCLLPACPCMQGLWRGTVPGLLLTIPYTAIQFLAVQQCREAASRMGLTREAQGTTHDTAQGTTQDTAQGTTQDTAQGTTHDTAQGTTQDTAQDTYGRTLQNAPPCLPARPPARPPACLPACSHQDVQLYMIGQAGWSE